MSVYKEYSDSLVLPEYVLGLSGDADYTQTLGANRTAQANLIIANANDIRFMCSVVDSVYKTFEGKYDDRNAVCDAFLEECILLGIGQGDLIMDMADALFEVTNDKVHEKYDGISEEPGSLFMNAVTMQFHRNMLRRCISLGVNIIDPEFLKLVTQKVKSYTEEDVQKYSGASLSFFEQ